MNFHRLDRPWSKLDKAIVYITIQALLLLPVIALAVRANQ